MMHAKFVDDVMTLVNVVSW